jgi:hypothetical protein
MQLIRLQPRNVRATVSPDLLANAVRPPGDDDPPPKGGMAIRLRDLRFDPPVLADALHRLAA